MTATPCVLTINGGSSSIKFAVFTAGPAGKRVLSGKLADIGQPEGRLTATGADAADQGSRPVAVPDLTAAAGLLTEWIHERVDRGAVVAVGHRLVHGGPRYWQPQRITPEMIAALRQLSPFDPEHLPGEIRLIEAFERLYPDRPQVACFDTAFHHDLPRVARLLPIPRRFEAEGVRRYGFHGLSCTYLLAELERRAGLPAARGRVILAHLGSGASLTAVRDGQSMDTTMGFTPAAGLVMSTRTGDLDPGLAYYLAQTEKMSAERLNRLFNAESGLLGVSEISPDINVLLAREGGDVRAAEAVELFCYQAKKGIGSFAAALGGLDTLVFAGGIGENLPAIRARICAGLDFLGIALDASRNAEPAGLISRAASRVAVWVIRTDEEQVIADSACGVLGWNGDERKMKL
jgi:acetate kinase